MSEYINFQLFRSRFRKNICTTNDLFKMNLRGVAVDNATLTRFFTIHFLLPFIVIVLVLLHLLFLHQTGSNNPLGVTSNIDKVPFHPYFSFKDSFGFIVTLFALSTLTLLAPYALGERQWAFAIFTFRTFHRFHHHGSFR